MSHLDLDITKTKNDSEEEAKAEKLRSKAQEKLDAAIAEFKRAIELEPALLEARLNLAEVYTQQKDLNRAEAQYRAILTFRSQKVREWNENVNFSQAYFGLARIAVARKKFDDAIQDLQNATKLNPNNAMAHNLLATQHYQRGNYREGENILSSWLAKLPPAQRRAAAEQFVKQLDDAGNHEAAGKAREAANEALKTLPAK